MQDKTFCCYLLIIANYGANYTNFKFYRQILLKIDITFPSTLTLCFYLIKKQDSKLGQYLLQIVNMAGTYHTENLANLVAIYQRQQTYLTLTKYCKLGCHVLNTEDKKFDCCLLMIANLVAIQYLHKIVNLVAIYRRQYGCYLQKIANLVANYLILQPPLVSIDDTTLGCYLLKIANLVAIYRRQQTWLLANSVARLVTFFKTKFGYHVPNIANLVAIH